MTREKRSYRSTIAVVLLLVLLAACGSDQEGDGVAAEGGDAADEDEESADSEAAGEFDAESYFQGKTIRMVITESAGGGTDTASRFMAQHMPDFIPGEPSIEATNLTGTAGMNRAYSAPGDELIIGTNGNGSAIYTTTEQEEAEHDPQDLQVLGATGPIPRVLLLSGELGYSDFGQLIEDENRDEAVLRFPGVIGGPDEIQEDDLVMAWLCDRLELSCEMLQVDDAGTAAADLMFERGEITADPGNIISRSNSLSDALQAGEVVLGAMYDVGEGPVEVQLPEGVSLPPELVDIMPEDLRDPYLRLLPAGGTGGLGRTLWTGPDMPEDVVNALREALDDMMSDPDVAAEFEELQGAPLQWISGADAQGILREKSTTYEENLDLYTELRQEYWDRYWEP